MKQQSYSPHILKVAFFAVTLGFLGLFGSDLYLPAMPAMKIAFNSSIASIEYSIAIYMVGFGLSPLLFGPLADRYGRKAIVTIGLSIALVGALIAGFSSSINTFLMARLIQGFGAGATLCIFRIMLRDVVQGERMALLASYTTMAFNLSPVLGMVIGSYVVHFANWRVCFWILIALYLIFLIIYLRQCPETLKQASLLKPKEIAANYLQLFSNKRLIGSALCSGLAFSTIFAFATAGAFIFQHQLHTSVIGFGWLGLALSLASIIGKMLNAKLVSKLSLQKIMLMGMVLIILAGICLLSIRSHTFIGTLLLICLASGSTAFIMSNAMAIGMQSHGRGTGTAASVYGSIQLLTCFISNGLLAHFAHFGIFSLSLFYVMIGLVAIIIKTITIRDFSYADKKEKTLTRKNA